MTELTLEALAKRVEALERKLTEQADAKKDWRSVVGISEDDEFTRLMRAEVEAIGEAERKAAREGTAE